MASIGGNTIKGVKFGIETTGGTGVPDFPEQEIYAKLDIPYGNTTNLQSAGKRQSYTMQLAVVVSETDWAAFKAARNFTPGTLIWSSNLARPNRTVRLLQIDDPRQFPGDGWRCRATFEG